MKNVLRINPEILKQVVSEVLPKNVATKDDIKMLFEFMSARFEDVNRRFEDTNRRFDDRKRRLDFIQKLIVFLLGLNMVNTSILILVLLKIFQVL